MAENLVLQPIEVVERFPNVVADERMLALLQQANETQQLIFLSYESRFGIIKITEMRIY